MITSNLSQNQPYVLPFKDRLFIFRKEEFYKLFPKRVVDYMVNVGVRRTETYELAGGYYFLPKADDLPVIIATRMSLSFPLLLSAVPLYTIKPTTVLLGELGEDDLQKNWFSDGGICSNFPIHCFDSWLPTRPTFGVNLTSMPKEGLSEDKTQVKAECLSATSSKVTRPNVDAVYLPKADESPVTEHIPLEDRWSVNSTTPAPSLVKFLWAIFSTAQNYRDNTQSVLPSYRERIVQIRLSDDEGGLNLAMPQNTIRQVIEKGDEAGRKLRDEFSFEYHQWVRFRVLMKHVEESLVSMNKVMRKHPIYSDIVRGDFDSMSYPYPSDLLWASEAAKRLQEIGELIERFSPPDLFAKPTPSPLPEPVLRVTPVL
jgi:hypothetical protein